VSADPGALRGRVAVVAGATGAVGGAIARALAAHGAALALLGRNRDALAALAAPLGETALACPGDLTDAGYPAAVRDAVTRRFGRLDVLVHAAGALSPGLQGTATVAALDAQYEVNARGPYRLTQALLPLLRAGQGEVVFVNSTLGLEARAGLGAYAAGKHALRAIADALRAEVNADGIRVLTLSLGRTASAMQAEVAAHEGRPYRPDELIQPDDVAAMTLAALLLPRTAEVTEIRLRPLRKPSDA